MSGFVGILNLDGAPVDQHVLDRMTRSLAFRGPDAMRIWCEGAVGLGHTLLRTTRKQSSDSANDDQPAALDGRLWIVADARIDARADLIEKLKGKSGAAGASSLSTPDAELILRAYDVWGDACVEHLIGDFSFAIWDARAKRLFCARDHFGVRPFFYALVGSCMIFSNTLDSVRQHPLVSGRLNDLAIADFLIFEMTQDPSKTSFADIRRLPSANILTCEQGKISARRYWELSVTTPVLFRREEEYIERFRELLDAAVADRLRAESAGILMSGGLDSSMVAASAQRAFARNAGTSGLHAYTEVFDSLIPHHERHYATLVADALKIPVEFVGNDHGKVFGRAGDPEYRTPEPAHKAWPDSTRDRLRDAAARCPVVMTGHGGDPALCGRITVHFRQLMKNKQFGQAVVDAARYLGAEGRMSRLYISTRWRILLASKKESPSYPPWLNEDLEKSLDLRDRWESSNCAAVVHPAVRPEAQEAMANPLWAHLFESHDAGSTGVAVEVCHPIFDLRLVNFLLALPRMPWCTDKELLREAARGRLPDAVRLRRKSPLAGDPLNVLLNRPESAWVDRFEPIPELEQYVVRNRIPSVHGERDTWRAWIHLRPLSLDYWLRARMQ